MEIGIPNFHRMLSISGTFWNCTLVENTSVKSGGAKDQVYLELGVSMQEIATYWGVYLRDSGKDLFASLLANVGRMAPSECNEAVFLCLLYNNLLSL